MDENFLKTSQPPDIADADAAGAAAIEAAAAAEGFVLLALDGARMKDKEALMDHAAAALALPGDFGRNWDALIDYLGSLAEFKNNDRVLVVVRNAAALEAAGADLYKVLREVCGDACDNARQWSRGRVVMKFVFVP